MYRAGPKTPRKAPEGGLVEEVVAQFADRYAYARELVQNSIDAGASAIEVRLEDTPEGLAVSFRDDGAGMTLEVVEGPLLTVFSSTKEGDSGKIGKYGIGFKSVLAVDPALVIVDTHRQEGSYRVRLSRDHSFQITEAEAKPGSGTTVTLVLALFGDERAEHKRKVTTALHAWCRFVRCPITLLTETGARSINLPFQLVAPVTVELQEDGCHVIVGPSQGTLQDIDDGSVDFAGFYCHGLTLLEAYSGDVVRPGLRFMVEGPGLSCTVSRDDVRRDASFRSAMKLVERIEKRQLPEVIDAALEREASFATGDVSRSRAYLSLLTAARSRRPASSVRVALVEPFGDETTLTLAELRKLAEDGRAVLQAEGSVFSRALAGRGLCVVRDFADAGLGRLLDVGFGDPRQRFALLLETEPRAAARPVLAALERMLARVGKPIDEVVVVRHERGLWNGVSLFVGGDEALRGDEGRAWLVPPRKPRGVVLLLKSSAILDAASACPSVARAASLLARLVLVESLGPLSAHVSDALLGEAVEVAS